MFRPPPYHPHGGPPRQSNGPYPGHSLGMSTGAPSFVSSGLPMHGRGGFRPPFHGGLPPYRVFSPSGPPLRPPPSVSSSPPVEAPPAPAALRDGNLRPLPIPAPPPPPAMPKDPEMLKNIEVLSAFVVKNGSNFEKLARAKQAGNPKFCFLFGGDPGTDAALGLDFYNWKKEHLLWVEERAKATTAADHQLVAEPAGQPGAPYGQAALAGGAPGTPGSPAGSDMDMEDDFATPEPADDRTADRDSKAAGPSMAFKTNPGFSSTPPHQRLGPLSPGREWKPDFSSPGVDRRPGPTFAASERGSALSRDSDEANLKPPTNAPVDRDSSKEGLPAQNADSRVSAGVLITGSQAARCSDSSNNQRITAFTDVPRRRDTRRRTGFDRPCMEDVVSPQASPRRTDKQRESSLGISSLPKGASGAGIQQVPTKSSRWGPEPSSERLSGGAVQPENMLDTKEAASGRLGSKKSDVLASKSGQMIPAKERGRSPDADPKLGRICDNSHAKHDESQKPKSGHEPAVDEFGRLLRQGGSDSDADDNYHVGTKRRRKSASRSRSGSLSPGSFRSKHRSPGRSPHRRGRRSRSRSHSPRWNRSHSDTPSREGRWGGSEGRGDRGGRRRGRNHAGAPPLCFDFVKGKCFRGSTCRFLHEESHGGPGFDQSGRRNGGRGREQGYGGREEGERSWSGKRGDDAKLRRPWASYEGNVDDNSRELTLIEELNRQERKSHGNESTKQENGDAEHVDKSSADPQRSESFQPFTATPNVSTTPLPSSPAVPSSQPQSGIPVKHGVQASQQMAVVPDPSVSQQLPVISNTTASIQRLGSLVSPLAQQSLMDSPTPHSQVRFPSVLAHQQQPALSMALQHQMSGFQRMPNVSQNNSFASGTVHQQFPFSSARSALSESPPLPTTTPSRAPFPVGQSQNSFNPPQNLNFASFPNNGGQNVIQFRLPMSSAPPQMLQTSLPPDVHQRSGMPWLAGGFGNPVSRPLGPPQLNQQLPPLAPPPHGPPSLAPPPLSMIPSSMAPPSMAPPSMAPPSMAPPAMFPSPIFPSSMASPSMAPPPPLASLPSAPPSQLPPSQATFPRGLSQQMSASPSVGYPYSLPTSYPNPTAHLMLPPKPATLQPSPRISDQYDPLADSFEPAPPGSVDRNGLIAINQIPLQENLTKTSAAVEQWRQNAMAASAASMTNAGEVVLENVSPGLPSRVDTMGLGNGTLDSASPTPQPHVVLENVSPTRGDNNPSGMPPPMKEGGLLHHGVFKTFSPLHQNLSNTGENHSALAPGTKEEKIKLKEGRVLNLIRKAVAEHVKEVLKPTWKGGQMSKEAFKTIAKKAVDKVMLALEAKGQIPKTQEKVDAFVNTSKPKIAKLVQGYVDKYVKVWQA